MSWHFKRIVKLTFESRCKCLCVSGFCKITVNTFHRLFFCGRYVTLRKEPKHFLTRNPDKRYLSSYPQYWLPTWCSKYLSSCTFERLSTVLRILLISSSELSVVDITVVATVPGPWMDDLSYPRVELKL